MRVQYGAEVGRTERVSSSGVYHGLAQLVDDVIYDSEEEMGLYAKIFRV